MKKYQFKPFDPVLVRDHDTHPWRASFFSHYMPKYVDKAYVCTCGTFNQCIPYNNDTAHLIGTNNPYEEPEPKIWYVTDLNTKSTCTMTQKQFEHFMKDILCSNADSAYQIGKIKK